MNKKRYVLVVVAMILALGFSALNIAPALADEIDPPPVTEETTPPAEGETDSVSEESASEETEAVVEEATVPQEGSAESPSQEATSELSEILLETPIVVANESGEILPLASQEAAEIIQTGDPIWCPAGVIPNPSLGGCTASYTTLEDLINAYLTNAIAEPNANGVIWILGLTPNGGADASAAAIVIDGADVNLGNWKNFSLTLNGGWAAFGSATMNTNDQSVFNQTISITGWNNAVTVNNIIVNTGGGAPDHALHIDTTGNVTVNNVDVRNTSNWRGGVGIDNSSGTGNVVVNDSTSNNNAGRGFEIFSQGTVTLKNVIAISNALNGVEIANNFSAAKAVTLNGTNQFNNNTFYGLLIFSKGVITLNNITANNNGQHGVYADNCNYDNINYDCNYAVANGVTIKGTNYFYGNGYDGLRVFSGGTITVNNLTANNNGADAGRPAAAYPVGYEYDAPGKGVFLHNFGATTAKAITVSGTNVFNSNQSTGLFAYSKGLITVSNLTAEFNGCDPLKDLDISYCAGVYLEGYGVTQTGYGNFAGNTESGLRIYSTKTVTLTTLFANGNLKSGVFVYGASGANITIAGLNVFTNNQVNGLTVSSNGTVTVSNITAKYNTVNGVSINNSFAVTPKAVSLSGINIFFSNGGTGLYILSHGAVTTSSVTSTNNVANGVDINNCDDDGFFACLTPSAQAVTMNGYNVSSQNTADGLSVNSRGVITINNITTNNNGGIGTILSNQYTNAVGGVNIKGYGVMNNNATFSGLNAYSNGAIVIANLTAMDNNTFGALINNESSPLVPQNVTLTGNNVFTGNDKDGLKITTFGTVVLNNVTASLNGNSGIPQTGFGVMIDNNNGTLAKAVTLNGVNTFSANYGTGLWIETLGSVIVSKITANNNSNGHGAYIDNQVLVSAASPVTISGFGTFKSNSQAGLYIYGDGNVSLVNITAKSNLAQYGAYISTMNNLTATSYASVTLTGFNTFTENFQDGLVISTDGVITLNNVNASANLGGGAYLDNTAGTLKNIILNGTNYFNFNKVSGLTFNASGSVTLTRIFADSNNDFVGGVPVSAGVVGTAIGSITFTCGSLNSNEGEGYYFFAGTTITLKGVYTYSNAFANFANVTPVITRACPLP